jgi:hypothetical protein
VAHTVFLALSIFFGLTALVVCGLIILIGRSERQDRRNRRDARGPNGGSVQ